MERPQSEQRVRFLLKDSNNAPTKDFGRSKLDHVDSRQSEHRDIRIVQHPLLLWKLSILTYHQEIRGTSTVH
jgi:hypothetical protein